MSGNYVGEIRMFGGNFAPADWHLCDGTLLPINQYDALYALIGTTYGGDGQSSFALPDLRSRVPLHQAAGYVLGQAAGTEAVTLTTAQMPAHPHTLMATNSGSSNSPNNTLLSTTQSTQAGTLQYGTGSGAPVTLSSASILPNSGGLPHSNLQPYLCINFIISLFGLYPSPS